TGPDHGGDPDGPSRGGPPPTGPQPPRAAEPDAAPEPPLEGWTTADLFPAANDTTFDAIRRHLEEVGGTRLRRGRTAAVRALLTSLAEVGMLPGLEGSAGRLVSAVRAGQLTDAQVSEIFAHAGDLVTARTTAATDALRRAVDDPERFHARGGNLVEITVAGSPFVVEVVEADVLGREPVALTVEDNALTIAVDRVAEPSEIRRGVARAFATFAADPTRFSRSATTATAPAPPSGTEEQPADPSQQQAQSGQQQAQSGQQQAEPAVETEQPSRPATEMDTPPPATTGPRVAPEVVADLRELVDQIVASEGARRRTAIDKLRTVLRQNGMRVGARDAGALRAALPDTLARAIADLADERRPAPAPDAVRQALTEAVDDLAGTSGIREIRVDEANPLIHHVVLADGTPRSVTLVIGPTPSGVVAATDPTDWTVTVDHRASGVAAQVAYAGALAERVAVEIGASTGEPVLRPGDVDAPLSGDDLTVADRRAKAELQLVERLLREPRVRLSAGRRFPLLGLRNAMLDELGLRGPGTGPVLRRGLFTTTEERSFASAHPAEPESLTVARQVVEAVAVQAGGVARRLDANRLTLTVDGHTIPVELRLGDQDLAEPVVVAGDATGLTVTVSPAAGERAVRPVVSSEVAAAVAELSTGPTEVPPRQAADPQVRMPAALANPEVGLAARLVDFVEQMLAARGFDRRVAVRAVRLLLEREDLRPSQMGGELRYQAMRLAGLVPDHVDAALRELTSERVAAQRREVRGFAVTAAQVAGALDVEPIGDGLALVTLPDGGASLGIDGPLVIEVVTGPVPSGEAAVVSLNGDRLVVTVRENAPSWTVVEAVSGQVARTLLEGTDTAPASGPAPQPAPPAAPSRRSVALDSRPLGRPGGLDTPDPVHEQALVAAANAVPLDSAGGRDPRLGEWFALANDGGPRQPGRANNCSDLAQRVDEILRGEEPHVAAPRTADAGPDGVPSPEGETNGSHRIEHDLGTPFLLAGPDAATGAAAIEQALRDGGPGTTALVVVSYTAEAGGAAHTLNAKNQDGTVLWLDAQPEGVLISTSAPLHGVEHMWSIVRDAQGRVLTPTTPEAAPLPVPSSPAADEDVPPGSARVDELVAQAQLQAVLDAMAVTPWEGRWPLERTAERLIRELGVRHDAPGSVEARRRLGSVLAEQVETFDGPTGSSPEVAAALPAFHEAARRAGAELDPAVSPEPPLAPTEFMVQVNGTATRVSINRAELARGDMAVISQPDKGRLEVTVAESADPAQIVRAITVVATAWVRDQMPTAMTGPVRRRLSLNAADWTSQHYGLVALVQTMTEELRRASGIPARKLRAQLQHLTRVLGIHPGVPGSGPRLQLVQELGLLTEEAADQILQLDPRSEFANRAVEVATAAVLRLAGHHGIVDISPIEGSTAYQVTTEHRTFQLDFVAGSVGRDERVDLTVDPTGKLVSVTVDAYHPLRVTKNAWLAGIEREVVSQFVDLLARQPVPGSDGGSSRDLETTDNVLYPGTMVEMFDDHHLSVADQVELARFAERVRQFGTSKGVMRQVRGIRLDREARRAGFERDLPGVERRRALLPEDVRQILAQRDGGRYRPARAAALEHARDAVRSVAADLGFEVVQEGPGSQVTVERDGKQLALILSAGSLLMGATVHLDEVGPGVFHAVASEWATRSEIERGMARRLGERFAVDPAQGVPPLFRPGPVPTGTTRDRLTASDYGRIAELTTLNRQIDEAVNPFEKAHLRRIHARLVQVLGLDQDALGADARRSLLGEELVERVARGDRFAGSGNGHDIVREAIAALRGVSAEAGVRAVEQNGDGLVVTLADGSRLPVRLDLSGHGGYRLANGLVSAEGKATLRVHPAAQGLPLRAALIRELARIAATVEELRRGEPTERPRVLRPGPADGQPTLADLTPADWAPIVEAEFLARLYPDASWADRRWIRRRLEGISAATGLVERAPGGDTRLGLMPAVVRTLLTEFETGTRTDHRTRSAETALIDVAERLGVHLASAGHHRYTATMPDGREVTLRLYLGQQPAGVVVAHEYDAETDLDTIDVSDSARDDQIRAAVSREAAAVLIRRFAEDADTGPHTHRGSVHDLSGSWVAPGQPAKPGGYRLAGTADLSELVPLVSGLPLENQLVRAGTQLPTSPNDLSVRDRAALVELTVLDQMAHDGSARQRRRVGRHAQELVERLGLRRGQPGAPARFAVLPGALQDVVSRHDGSLAAASERSVLAAADTALLDAIHRGWPGMPVESPAPGTYRIVVAEGVDIVLRTVVRDDLAPGMDAELRGEELAVSRTAPPYAVKRAVTVLVSEAVAVEEPGGVAPDDASVLGRPVDPASPPVQLSGADYGQVGLLRLLLADRLAGRMGEPTEIELLLLLERLGLAADQPGAEVRRGLLPLDVRADLHRLDGHRLPDGHRAVREVRTILGSPEFAVDAGVARIRPLSDRPSQREQFVVERLVSLDRDDPSTEVMVEIRTGALLSGETVRVDGNVLTVSETASREQIEVELARRVAELVAPPAADAAADQLALGAPVTGGTLSRRDRGAVAAARVVARQTVGRRGRAVLSPRFAAIAARTGLTPGLEGAEARRRVVADETGPLATQLGRLADSVDRIDHSRLRSAGRMMIQARSELLRESTSVGAALGVASVVSAVVGRPVPAILLGSMAVAGSVALALGEGRYLNHLKHESTRGVDAKAAAAEARRDARQADEAHLLERITAVNAALRSELERAGVPVPEASPAPSRRVAEETGRLDRLDLDAVPEASGSRLSSIGAKRLYALKVTPAPVMISSVAIVAGLTSGLLPLFAATFAAWVVLAVVGPMGEQQRYDWIETETDAHVAHQADRTREARALARAAANERRTALLAEAETMARLASTVTTARGVEPPAGILDVAPGRPNGQARVVRVPDLVPFSLAAQFPHWKEHLFKAGSSPAGIGTIASMSFVAVLVGAPVLVGIGLAGALVGTLVAGTAESRMKFLADQLSDQRERVQAEREANRATRRSVRYAEISSGVLAARRAVLALAGIRHDEVAAELVAGTPADPPGIGALQRATDVAGTRPPGPWRRLVDRVRTPLRRSVPDTPDGESTPGLVRHALEVFGRRDEDGKRTVWNWYAQTGFYDIVYAVVGAVISVGGQFAGNHAGREAWKPVSVALAGRTGPATVWPLADAVVDDTAEARAQERNAEHARRMQLSEQEQAAALHAMVDAADAISAALAALETQSPEQGGQVATGPEAASRQGAPEAESNAVAERAPEDQSDVSEPEAVEQPGLDEQAAVVEREVDGETEQAEQQEVGTSTPAPDTPLTT
ncbi:MAG TPA: toxin glutamine deamidase domain-containing protein, partial [Cryptosporangiaceae bacterium]|nr:toxin glutamine deamidase domain-containing protein [Cryptosporangiaceae bacterium]